jgi:hypothetical protein
MRLLRSVCHEGALTTPPHLVRVPFSILFLFPFSSSLFSSFSDPPRFRANSQPHPLFSCVLVYVPCLTRLFAPRLLLFLRRSSTSWSEWRRLGCGRATRPPPRRGPERPPPFRGPGSRAAGRTRPPSSSSRAAHRDSPGSIDSSRASSLRLRAVAVADVVVGQQAASEAVGGGGGGGDGGGGGGGGVRP